MAAHASTDAGRPLQQQMVNAAGAACARRRGRRRHRPHGGADVEEVFDRRWNEARVMRYFQGPPNYWDADSIRRNVLLKYSPQGIAATRFDPKSIMLYAFGAELFSDGLGSTNENSTLSSADQSMIREMYPR
ncbi:MAG: hypothetical protein LC125_12655 [Burkholderiales bacterium]|nr:hypothetical protein [Burkholderiales bacterium]